MSRAASSPLAALGPLAASAIALAAVAGVSWLSAALLPVLGLTSAALLFLLPVLLAASVGGVGPGLVAALGGAAAYNFFLLEPRYTFRVHELENLVSVFVLGAVAIVTSRLATRLKAREAEALERARCSDEAAALAAVLAEGAPGPALTAGIAWLTERYGAIRLLDEAEAAGGDGALSSLDQAAAGWALHNRDWTGHGTEIMPAAEWTFFPLAPKNRLGAPVAAIARPATGTTRSEAELEHLAQLCLLLGQCRDRAELETALRGRAVLEESERLRRTFLASLAHDFRTPLTVITGRLEQLGATSAEAREALEAARRLDRTMSDLLGAARIEEGSLVPRIESVDPVDAVAAACAGLAVPEGVRLERRVPADLPFVAADPVLLGHVLVNLIDNALRHARGVVTIAGAARGTGVMLTVEDDGPGIPEAERARVFERFARLEGSDRAGSGLGLAIVRGFAEAMGMTVTLDESPLGGARFALILPPSRGAAAP
ncbi:DUF4118 domain-containing protein [Novosphingobium flavum]|uniref:histidine kinase n=1 Tax=Novosphingobium flavum TaxID=1778672 RepID=A0A7X1FTP6_9SPHN|nr:DUF4118 domain-containing protein [Novosphingobium flavum]MBC2666805.1 DUF4118 domain-containing protein [Novosphingobium flavum]